MPLKPYEEGTSFGFYTVLSFKFKPAAPLMLSPEWVIVPMSHAFILES